jgi:threonine-phosphate decarboxylase
MLHGHGDDRYQYSQEIKADFSTNVWYGGEPAGLKDHLLNNWSVINRYPEPLAETLSARIAQRHQLSPENVLVTNGSIESIYLIAQAWRKAVATIVVPSFSEYEDACRLYNHSIQFLNWENMRPDISTQAGLFFICNPNNPTGAVFPELETFNCSKFPNHLRS